MKTTCFVKIRLTLGAAALALAACPAPAAGERESQMIAILEADSPRATKAITCKQLAVHGTRDAVPALAGLLPDEELTSWARIALEVIPGPEADAALRDALGKVQGRVRVGIINSLGVRRDAAAVDALAALLKDTDTEASSAAAVALGHIGNAAAAGVLARSLNAAAADVRAATAEGCILCAEHLLAAGKAQDAARLYDLARKADVPRQRIAEATRGAILARGDDGVPLLSELLAASDRHMFTFGLTTAREIAGPAITAAVAAALTKAPPDRQAPLLMALADRDDPTVLPSILLAARSGAKPVRIAAIGALNRIGDASCVPFLLETAVQSDAELAQAAKTALEELPGAGVNADLAARLAQAKGALRTVLIDLAGRRHIEGAAPELLKAADDADAATRAAALMALGATIGPRDLDVLVRRVISPRHAEDSEAAERALLAASVRMPDREACAAQLADAMWDMPAATRGTVLKRRWDPTGGWGWVHVSPRSTILEVLGAMGGKKALETMIEAAGDDDPELQDTGIHMLSQWLTTDAAPALLELARKASNPKLRIRAVHGTVRFARDFDLPNAQRAAMCRAALGVAARDEDRKMILEVMQKHPSLDMLRVLVEAAKMPALKQDAGQAALSMAQKVGGEATDVRALLEQLGQGPVKVEIIKAEYGAGASFRDVTEMVRRHASDFPLIVLPSASYNASFGGDPAPGIVKQLKIRYKLDGKEGEVSLQENAPVLLPAPK